MERNMKVPDTPRMPPWVVLVEVSVIVLIVIKHLGLLGPLYALFRNIRGKH